MNRPTWWLVFDGGSKRNPGLGYGSYRIRGPEGEWSDAVQRIYGEGVTNNEAEYTALTEGLRDLAKRCGDPSAITVEIRGDSKLVIEQLSGSWRIRAHNLIPFYRTATRELGRFGEARLKWHARDKSVELLGH